MADSHKSRLEKAVDVAMQFYEVNSILVAKRPSISFDGREQPMANVAAARARIELQAQEAIQASITRVMSQTIFKQMYGLTISREATEQYAAEMSRGTVTGTRDAFGEMPTDIVALPYYFTLPLKEQESYIVHELWHIIEADCGIFQRSPLLGEGTATLVQSRYMGQKCALPMQKCTGFLQLYYQGIATELEGVLGSLPFKSLLDADIRAEAEQIIIPKLKEYAPKLIENMLKHPQFKAVYREMMRHNPIVSALPKNVVKEDILNVFRAKGQHLLASELEAQDCSKLIETYKEFL